MSYILDALKKAERERGTMRVPMPSEAGDPPGRRWNRTVSIAGGLLVCSAAVLLLFWPSLTSYFRRPRPLPVDAEQNRAAIGLESEQVGGTARSSSAAAPFSPQAPSAIPKSGRAQSTPAPGASELRSSPRAAAAPTSEASMRMPDAGAQSSRDGVRSATSIAKSESQREPQRAAGVQPIEVVPPRPDPGPANPPTKENVPTPRTAQAGGSLEEAVARMTLNMLVYEDAEADRRVFINGKKYVKGDLVEGKYLIERITIEGATLSYEGTRVLLRPR